MSSKDMSNAEKVQIASEMIVAIDDEDADGVSEVVVKLISQNNPRLTVYAPVARLAMAAVLRRLFGGANEDADQDKEALEKVARDTAAAKIAERFKKDKDRDYAWYDPRGWF